MAKAQMRIAVVSVLISLALPLCLAAQSPWSGILDSSRATDWTEAGIPGGIPNRTTVCATVAPSGVPAWQASTAYSLNQKIADTNGNTETTTTAGTSGAMEPTSWSTSGGTTADGTVTWTESAGGTDSSKIGNAIASCPANQVVVLAAASYVLTDGITFGTTSNVTLRGAGADQTILNFYYAVTGCTYYDDICVEGSNGWENAYAGTTSWTGTNGTTGTYTKGAAVLDLGSATGLSVGQLIILDQRNDDLGIVASPSGATESGSTVTITASSAHNFSVGNKVTVSGVGVSGYNGTWTITAVTSTTFQYTDTNTGLAASGGGYATVDTGGVLMGDIHGFYINEYATSGRSCPDSNSGNQCAAGEISRRSEQEFKTITAISGNQITVTPPLEFSNWRASQAPGLWWTGNINTLDGIENLTLDMTNDPVVQNAILFDNTYECWVKGVRSINSNVDHVDIILSARDEVVDSYFWGTKGGATKSYGIEAVETSDDLIQNNICQHIVGCVVSGDFGSVYAYNYIVDSGDGPSGWLIGMLVPNHDFGGYDLIEGNDTDASYVDNVHGTGAAETWFRNRLRGQDTPLKLNDQYSYEDSAFNRAENVIGNIQGSIGWEPRYQGPSTLGVNSQFYVNVLGIPNEGSPVPYDAITAGSALRWGNYDAATGGVRWCGNSSDPGWGTYCTSTIAASGASESGSTVTITATNNPYPFSPGQVVTVSGVGISGYNGTWTVTGNPTSQSFTYTDTNTGLAASGGGTVTASEIPTSGITFINGNAVPSSTVLPASFYLSSQPAFWTTKYGTPPWPAIGPEVTGGTAPDTVAGHSYSIPAQLVYANTPIDPAYQHTFTVTGATWSTASNPPEIVLTLSSPNNIILPAQTAKITGITPAAYNGVEDVSGPGLGAPAFQGITAVAGSGPPAGTYQGEITWVTAFGETTPSAPASAATSGSNLSLQFATYTPPGLATSFNIYLTTAGGAAFYKQVNVPINGTNCPSDCYYTFSGSSISTSTLVPTVNTSMGNEITFAAPAWNAGTLYSTGSVIFDSNGNIETATTGGTTSATQPTWPTGGLQTNDGTVTWTESSPTYVSGGTVTWSNILLFNANAYYASGSGTAQSSNMSGAGSAATKVAGRGSVR